LPSIKKLVLKNLSSSQYSSSSLNKDSDDLASPSEYPQNGHSQAEDDDLREVPGVSGRADDDPEVTQFYVNPIAKPIPQGRAQPSLQDTISDLNMHKQPRNDLEVSRSRRSEDREEEEEEEQQESKPSPHPAGIVLHRVGYYTIPPLDDLAEMLDENGECVVENFTVGRKGSARILPPEMFLNESHWSADSELDADWSLQVTAPSSSPERST
uniref:Peptidase S59 domain-containing protein n=1 Tax=Xiphophorus maculatus TaxID=8083 RepID=A0A3B5PXE3_XIPMA